MTTSPAGVVPTLELLSTLPTCATFREALPNVTTADGQPVIMVIRALTFGERRAALKAALTKDGTLDDELLALEIVRRGVVEPKFSAHHTSILESLNANLIDHLASAINALGSIDPRYLDARLAELAGTPPPPTPTAAERERDDLEPSSPRRSRGGAKKSAVE